MAFCVGLRGDCGDGGFQCRALGFPQMKSERVRNKGGLPSLLAGRVSVSGIVSAVAEVLAASEMCCAF